MKTISTAAAKAGQALCFAAFAGCSFTALTSPGYDTSFWAMVAAFVFWLTLKRA